jgi:hypothetical protein
MGILLIQNAFGQNHNASENMEEPFILPGKDLEIKASSTSSAKDFNFFTGNWYLDNHKLKERLAHCVEWLDFPATQSMSLILHGIGNRDNYLATIDGKAFEGMTLRLFNPKTKLWSIYWTDSNSGTLEVPMVGSFDHNIGLFYARDIFHGKPVIVMFKWDKSDPIRPIWSQAFSDDEGKTWEWNWFMYFQRR